MYKAGLDKIAQVARGASINVLPTEDIEVAVSQVFRRLSGPILAWPTLTAQFHTYSLTRHLTVVCVWMTASALTP